MAKDKALKLALEALENNKRTHHYCEDTWYSCPKHEDGCANEAEGVECNCGADNANAEIDKAITAIREVLAQPEQAKQAKPVAIVDSTITGHIDWLCTFFPKQGTKLYTSPPPRQPLTDEEIKTVCAETWSYDPYVVARAIEAAHRIK